MQNEVIRNLIKAMSDYGLENSWSDSDIIETLVNCGITEKDFISCGYGEFECVRGYFDKD